MSTVTQQRGVALLDWCHGPKLTVDVAGGGLAKMNCGARDDFWMTFFHVSFTPTRDIDPEVAVAAE